MSKEFDHKVINNVIHSRIRLAIISYLYSVDKAEFNELKTKVKTSDGNLSVHLKKLEDEKYIDVHKYFDGKIPKTSYKVTNIGKKAFEEYVNILEDFINLN